MPYNSDIHVTAGQLRWLGVENIPDDVRDDDYTESAILRLSLEATDLLACPCGCEVMPKGTHTIVGVEDVVWQEDNR